jgi:hypothetical protein
VGIKVTTRGSFSKSQAFLERMKRREQFKALAKYGSIGVAALAQATPKDSSLASNSWYYEIVDRPGYFAIHWYNRDLENGFPVAVMVQYGHATRRGGYIEGRDFINPAMRPIFDQIAAEMWREVTK